jgi:hypothetical protein
VRRRGPQEHGATSLAEHGYRPAPGARYDKTAVIR